MLGLEARSKPFHAPKNVEKKCLKKCGKKMSQKIVDIFLLDLHTHVNALNSEFQISLTNIYFYEIKHWLFTF